MITHIGDSKAIYLQDVIGIFHLTAQGSAINQEFVESTFKTFFSEQEIRRNKSFIVTTDNVRLSPVSTLTLVKRSNLGIDPPNKRD